MKYGALSGKKLREVSSGILCSLDDSPRFRPIISWLILLCGLVVWTGVQSAFVVIPLWTRALPPEVDDSLTYVLKTTQMEECFNQDCLALEDLRKQCQSPTSDPEIAAERRLVASRVFPLYHPLLSVIFLGLKKFGWDLMTVYKLVWSVGPFFFGLAFACLLATLFGLPAAGLALALLAFKVFPDTGLNPVVPSNIAMGMGVLLWARVISREGDAPWSMIFGSLALVAMHPVGRVYSLIAAFVSLLTPGFSFKPRRFLPVLFIFLLVALTFMSFSFLKRTGLVNISILPGGGTPLLTMAMSAAQSMAAVIVEIVRLKDSLFGSIPVFCGAFVFGLFVMPREARRTALRVILIYAFFLAAIFFYVSSHPADVIFRIWIPLIVMLFGAVGYGIWYALRHSAGLLIARLRDPRPGEAVNLQQAVVVVILAILLGYSFQMITSGGEHLIAAGRHLRNRQPLMFDPSQPELLLSQAKPGDRVLYTSIMIMPYYFIHGAMRLGAVYYHPSMEGSESVSEWLERPDLRFAVTYNPTVYHPTYEGVAEHRWWVTSPEYRFSPLSKGRKHGPIAREGMIRASDFRWIDIKPRVADFAKTLNLTVKNRGKSALIEVIPADRGGVPLSDSRIKKMIPSDFSGRVELDLGKAPQAERFRIALPRGDPKLLISAIVFGNDKNHWPWAQKADLTFMPKDPETGAVLVSFDPGKILPPSLNEMKITVLNDNGSSVLFRMDRK